VAPIARTEDGTRRPATNWLREELEAYAADPQRASTLKHLWVRAPAGIGKSTLLQRLYFELIGAVDVARSRAVPTALLVQPRNLKATEASRLQQAKDPLAEFFTVWLEKRNLFVADEPAPLVNDFLGALERGDIVLLLDGYDDLRNSNLAHVLDAL